MRNYTCDTGDRPLVTFEKKMSMTCYFFTCYFKDLHLSLICAFPYLQWVPYLQLPYIALSLPGEFPYLQFLHLQFPYQGNFLATRTFLTDAISVDLHLFLRVVQDFLTCNFLTCNFLTCHCGRRAAKCWLRMQCPYLPGFLTCHILTC